MKHQPEGFEILHEDQDIIVGNKSPGFLTVSALWEKENTIHQALNRYVRKGNSKSKKSVFVVHRLDQHTSGVLIFAKTQAIQQILKENWSTTQKTYYAIIHGKMSEKKGLIESYLIEEEDYLMRSTKDEKNGKLAKTEYQVVKETPHFSIVKVNLITGKKNQIRVHFSEAGHPVVGDTKYGQPSSRAHQKNLMLHSFALVFNHPFTQVRMRIQCDVPDYFKKLVPYGY